MDSRIFDFDEALFVYIILVPLIFWDPTIGISAAIVFVVWRKKSIEKSDKRDHEERIAQITEFKKEQDRKIKNILEKVNQGDSESMYDYGDLILKGDGLQKNEKLAFDWMSAAASKGSLRAIEMVAKQYFNGGIVEQDLSKALYYYRLAYNQRTKGEPNDSFGVSPEVYDLSIKISEIENKLKETREDESERNSFNASKKEWVVYNSIFELCESSPELSLLKEIIRQNSLKPCLSRKLIEKIDSKNNTTLKWQKTILMSPLNMRLLTGTSMMNQSYMN